MGNTENSLQLLQINAADRAGVSSLLAVQDRSGSEIVIYENDGKDRSIVCLSSDELEAIYAAFHK